MLLLVGDDLCCYWWEMSSHISIWVGDILYLLTAETHPIFLLQIYKSPRSRPIMCDSIRTGHRAL